MGGNDARGLRPIACAGRKHADVSPDATGQMRVVCRDRRCRLSPNEFVVHTFDLATGLIVREQRFAKWRNPHEAPQPTAQP